MPQIIIPTVTSGGGGIATYTPGDNYLTDDLVVFNDTIWAAKADIVTAPAAFTYNVQWRLQDGAGSDLIVQDPIAVVLTAPTPLSFIANASLDVQFMLDLEIRNTLGGVQFVTCSVFHSATNNSSSIQVLNSSFDGAQQFDRITTDVDGGQLFVSLRPSQAQTINYVSGRIYGRALDVAGTIEFAGPPALLPGTAVESANADLFSTFIIPQVLNDLNDVDIPAPVDGDVLTFNNATQEWESIAPTTGVTSALTVDRLDDNTTTAIVINNWYPIFTGNLPSGSMKLQLHWLRDGGQQQACIINITSDFNDGFIVVDNNNNQEIFDEIRIIRLASNLFEVSVLANVTTNITQQTYQVWYNFHGSTTLTLNAIGAVSVGGTLLDNKILFVNTAGFLAYHTQKNLVMLAGQWFTIATTRNPASGCILQVAPFVAGQAEQAFIFNISSNFASANVRQLSALSTSAIFNEVRMLRVSGVGHIQIRVATSRTMTSLSVSLMSAPLAGNLYELHFPFLQQTGDAILDTAIITSGAGASFVLAEANDVDDGAGIGLQDGMVARYDLNSLTYNIEFPFLNDMADVNLVGTPPVNGDILEFNGTDWLPVANTGGAPVDSVFSRTGVVVALVGDYSAFYAPLVHTHVEADITDLQAYLLNINGESIDELSDVDTTTIAPNVGDHLEWDGSNWVPALPAAGPAKTIFSGITNSSNSETLFTDQFVYTLQGGEVIADVIEDFSLTFMVQPAGVNWEISANSDNGYRILPIFRELSGDVVLTLDLMAKGGDYKSQNYRLTVLKH